VTRVGEFDVVGAIEVKWLQKGGLRGFLGAPMGNEQPAFNGIDRVGRLQHFAGGMIAWHPSVGGAHEVHGLIGARWTALGDVRFGFPITDESTTPDKKGRYNHFRGMHLAGTPEASIYWHPDTGAHDIYGGIRSKWASLGWEKSKVGYPTASETDRAGSGRTQAFQTGSISWTPGTGAWIDWFRLDRRIITPSGTALGGGLSLEIHQNGHTFFWGRLHNSSDVVSYKALVRATFELASPLGSPNGTLGETLLFQKGGEVDESLNWFEPEYHPLLRAHWPEVERGNLAVSKSYEMTGVLSDVGQLALDAITFVVLSATVGGNVASACLIAKGLSTVTKKPIGGLPGTLGIIAVAATTIMVGPSFALPVFIGAAVVTELLFGSRAIFPEEYEFAKTVFGESLPPRERIILTNISGVQGRGFTVPSLDGTSVLLNIGSALDFAGGPMRYHSDAYPAPGQLLIHELVHAWQFYRSSRFVAGYLCRGLAVQLGNYLPGESSYTPPSDPNSSWSSDFGMEQEAATVDTWFKRHAATFDASGKLLNSWTTIDDLRTMLKSEAARKDRFFRYIERNIRMGEDNAD
jgi:hypothetical protein